MIIRSFIFHCFFYSYAFLFYCICFPILYILPAAWTHSLVQLWAKGVIICLRLFGIKTEIRGHHYKPKGAFIVASKHQSEWETQVSGYDIKRSIFVVKKELFQRPFFGWILKKTGMIAVDRSGKTGVMKQMLGQALPYLQKGRCIIIYPEGTRTEIDALPQYKPGIAMLYKHAQVPVVPVAINSGLFWRKNKLLRTGTAILEYLEPIQPGLDPKIFMEILQERIESGTKKLIEEQI